jgi:hypothetical protein
MAKRKNDFSSPAEDYVDQLNWRANQSRVRDGYRSNSVHYEPRWKYQIFYLYPPTTPLGRVIRVFVLAGLVGLPAYVIFSSDAALGAKIFFSFMLALIVAVIFFAARDASKDRDDKPDDLDS